MQTKHSSYAISWLGRPAYAVAAFLILASVGTVGTGSWPVNITEVRWRYDSENILSGFVVAIAMGLLLASAVAAGFKHRLILRILAVLNVVIALGFLTISIDYMLDGLQLRGQVDRERLSSFELSVTRGILLFFAAGLLAIWIGVASYRAAKQIEADRPREEGHPLVSI